MRVKIVFSFESSCIFCSFLFSSTTRSCLPPLGYIIDISRDGENGEEQTTRATVSTGTPASTGFFGGLSGFGGGLAGLLRGDPDDKTEEGKYEREKIASASASGGLQSSSGDKKEKEVTKTPPSKPSASVEEKMDVDEKETEATKKEKKEDDSGSGSGVDDQTPRYLARVVGELIKGMVGEDSMYNVLVCLVCMLDSMWGYGIASPP